LPAHVIDLSRRRHSIRIGLPRPRGRYDRAAMDHAPSAVRAEDETHGDPGAAAAGVAGLASPRAATLSPGLFKELVLHLVKREIDATHRMTVLGWAWPVARQLVQLAVLVFIFGSVLDSGIKHFPVYVFSGLIAWTWFAGGIAGATSSLLSQRHLLHQPRLPPAVLPMVAIVVPLVDVLMALPVLALMLLASGGIPWTALLVPVLVLAQLVLMSGIAWLASAGSVFLRDIPNIVAVGLNVLFYLTPVFYSLHKIPQQYAGYLKLNPMATIVDMYRALLLGQPYPGALAIAYTATLSVVLMIGGYVAFHRVQHRFVDSL
jgi:lipopolysaccharide transport system permease protein